MLQNDAYGPVGILTKDNWPVSSFGGICREGWVTDAVPMAKVTSLSWRYDDICRFA
jgi:hypothetical protein